MRPVKVADVVVVEEGSVEPMPPYVKLVAPVPDCHETVKPVLVISEDVMTGGVGAAINVVTGTVFDTASPPFVRAVIAML